MRFARISRISPKFALAACMAAVLVLGSGCDTTGDLRRAWFNPTEVGRFKREPLMMPIVNSLDTGVEEPNDQFAQATDVKSEDLVAANRDYVIGKNDLLSISITDLVAPGVETVKSSRVSESGNVSLPLIGQIRAEGMSEAQLEEEIRKAYRDQNLMPNAQVSVSVQQALARTFSILGTVARPGLYGINQADFRILDALVTAGDISSQGVEYLYVIRREDVNAAPTTMPAPGGMKPGTAPAAPNDVLTPKSQGNEFDYKKVTLLMQDPGAGAAPAVPPAAPKADDGKYIVIDGKPVLVGNQPATAEPAAPGTPGTAPAAVSPEAPPAAPPMTGAATQPFEFSGPAAPGNTRIIRVPVFQVKNGDLRYNIVVRPQDMIMVPPPTTGEYYMDGHINRTGVYSLTARNITLKQAIAAAGGFDQLAIPTHTELIRRIGSDHEVYAKVDLDKVFGGMQPDIYLKPNDVVRVGTNAFAPFMAAFRNSFRMTYGFGFLYDRNFAPLQRPIVR